MLTLFDCICILVGTIVGAGIYETTPVVAACMGGWVGIMGIWLVGGLLALCGALCYAELAATYPEQGGDVVYLTRAYGSWAGFLFGWGQLAVIRPGDIALMAFVFGRYASALYAPFPSMSMLYAAFAVGVMTFINVIGVRESKWTQDALTVVKMAGLLFIAVAGFAAPGHAAPAESGPLSAVGFELALILVLFTYGGWNEMAYVAAEVRHPGKNIVRSLLLGTAVVVIFYLLANGAFLHALGYEGVITSPAVAVDTVGVCLPRTASRIVAVIICISALGAVNGLVFTGARVSYALGAEHRLFHPLGHWNPLRGTPVAALVLQGILSLGIVLVAGSFIDTILYSAPAVWLFFLATGTALFRLRRKERARGHSFRVPAYPLIPLVFCAASGFMLYSSISYAFREKPVGLLVLSGVMILGAVLCWRAGAARHNRQRFGRQTGNQRSRER